MSEISGSDCLDHSGDDSDGEGSIASSHASVMPCTPDSRKHARPKQILGNAWPYHGIITTDADLLHTESVQNEEGLFPRLAVLLRAHWISVFQHLQDRIQSSFFISSSSAPSQASWRVRPIPMMRRRSTLKFGRSVSARERS